MLEYVRRSVRRAFAYDSTVYRLVSQTYTLSAVARSEGFVAAVRIRRLERSKSNKETCLQLKRLSHPIYIREGTPDIPTVINTVIREEYGQRWNGVRPLRMIDAGAYIGDTSAYFLSRFPGITVVALEPNGSNFALAEKNLAPYGNRVKLYNMALDGAPGLVHMSGEHLGAAIASSASGQDTGAIEATSIPKVLDAASWDDIDILKMDIEGAEAAVLNHRADSWLARVRRVILEPHGAEIEAKVRATLVRNGFTVARHRSLLYALREGGGE